MTSFLDGAVAVCEGAAVHAHGALLLAKNPSVLFRCIPCVIATVSSAVAAASALWLGCWVLRLWPLRWVVKFDTTILCASLVILYIAQTLWPTLSGRVFFASYSAAADPATAQALESQRKLHGLRAMLRELVIQALAGIGILTLVLATAGLWIPVVFAAIPVALLLSPATIAALSLLLVSGGLLLKTAAPALALFSRLKAISFGLAMLLSLCALVGVLPAGAVKAVTELAYAYLLASAHAKQLLAQYSIRQPARDWQAFCDKQHWTLIGFGLPLVALFRWVHPLASLALLEITHASAAVLLHRLKRGSIPVSSDSGAALSGSNTQEAKNV